MDQKLHYLNYLAEMIGRRCHHNHGEAFWILGGVDDDGRVVEHGLPEGVGDPAVGSLHPGESLYLLKALKQDNIIAIYPLIERKKYIGHCME